MEALSRGFEEGREKERREIEERFGGREKGLETLLKEKLRRRGRNM